MTMDFTVIAPAAPAPAADEPEERVVRFRGFEAAIAETNRRYAAGEIDEAAFAALVETRYDDGDYADTSFGMQWLRRRFDLDGERNGRPNVAFNQFVEQVIPDLATFLMEHMPNWMWTASVLMSRDILGLMDHDTLVAFVEIVFQHTGSWNKQYVQVWRELEIPRESIARCILNHLHRAQADHERQHNTVTAVHDFLRFGSGVYEHNLRWERTPAENSEWAMLSDEQFNEALEICLAKSPSSILEHRQQLRLRLSEEQVGALCTRAVEVLAKADKPAMRPEFFGLSLFLRTRVCDRFTTDGTYYGFEGIAEFVLTTAADIEAGETGLGGIWLDQVPIMGMENMSPATVYRAALRLRQAREWKTFPAWLARRLDAYLTKGGYEIGKVGRSRNTRTNLMEDVVEIGRNRYIHDTFYRGGDTFYPREGEEVLLCTRRANPILSRAEQRPVCIGGWWLFRVTFVSLRVGDEERS